MTVKSALTRVLGIIACASVLLRTDLAIAFGKGTGVNKTPVSALGVTANFALNNVDRLPEQMRPVTKRLLVALAIPGEAAIEHGLLPAPKKSSSPKKRFEPTTLEGKATEWLKRQKASSGMKEVLSENTFAIAGAGVILFSSLLAVFWPYECMQNLVLGFGFFWFGVNGALGHKASFTPEFFASVIILCLGLFFLAEEDPKRAAEREAARLKKENEDFADDEDEDDIKKKKSTSTEDEWDDGIGNVSAETMRSRKAAGCTDGCCS
eukprot:CAMPEP_0171514774 /NCGR_PEP_ID=MMETSP0959-20130129/3046_1 /TAXON_ID=87120 /ORGANISM="Aurantiochytrium limacinum, Strain ATCCMYA-1381" /LENGTH=264 /DNA_ID=CAMNT_0012053167 /DNA_START=288 /DNA_END=1082 /DNA_ORIENTATION=+